MNDYSLYYVWSMILNVVGMWSGHNTFGKGNTMLRLIGYALFGDLINNEVCWLY